MKHVLIIHYHFLPVHNVAVKHLLGYTRHFPAHGWKALVLTRNWKDVEEADASWGLSWEPQLEASSACTIYRVSSHGFKRRTADAASSSERAQLPPLHRVMQKAASKIRRVSRLLTEPYPDEFAGWVTPAVKAGAQIAREKRIQVLLSYCPPESNHVVARRLSRQLGIPWIPFFGDLYGFLEPPLPAHSIEGIVRGAWHRWCMRPAAACVGISPAMTAYLEQRYRKRAILLHAGFDPSEFTGLNGHARDSSDPFTIAHVGSLYPGDQLPELFFDGLDLLLTRSPALRERIRVLFVGSKCDDALHAMLRGRPSRYVCAIQPRVDSATAVAMVRSSTALLAFTCTATRGRFGTMSYPTKIFESLGARLPVLVVPSDDDWVDELVTRTGAGATVRDANQIADTLMEWYADWDRTGRVSYKGREDAIMKFTQERQARLLVDLFEEVRAQ